MQLCLYSFSPQILKIELPTGTIEPSGNACELEIGTSMNSGFFVLTWTEKVGKNHGVSDIGTAIVNIHSVLLIAPVPLVISHQQQGRLALLSPSVFSGFLSGALSEFS